ncbi:DUF3813 domain-containing protein [Bacillus massilinigeriensis]|uniref:DUF3813 domain-containing protein n=1 Tax=Bacillus mediterraneensis TaxID=1805474 RepID=UPI0008F856D3|nr:DUF3813 domain-containing protein [Bacillus mediterraneensis]
MGNKLFQEARQAVHSAISAPSGEREKAVQIAENSLSSAFANSTLAEKKQLRDLQDELDSVKG